MKPRKFIIPFLLLIQTVYCWWCFFEAKNLPYDENYGILIQAILISMAVWVALRMIRAWKRDWYHLQRFIFWTWLIVGSPLAYILGLIFYKDLFGHLAL
jgi:hypothetical protein